MTDELTYINNLPYHRFLTRNSIGKLCTIVDAENIEIYQGKLSSYYYDRMYIMCTSKKIWFSLNDVQRFTVDDTESVIIYVSKLDKGE